MGGGRGVKGSGRSGDRGGGLKKKKGCLRRTSVLTDPHPPQPDSRELVPSPQYGSTLPRVRVPA